MTSVLDRVAKLIALTASPSEEEARTSAFLACKLVREHKLVVVEQDPFATAWGRYSTPPPRRPEPPPPPPPKRPEPARDVPRFVRLASKYSGQCRYCGDAYAVGDSVHWKRGFGVLCVDCLEVLESKTLSG